MCSDEGRILYFYDRGPGDPQGNQYIPCPLCEAEKQVAIEKAWRAYEEANYRIVNDLCYMWRDLYRTLRDHIRKQNGQPKGKWGGQTEEFGLLFYKHTDLLEQRDEARKKLEELGEL